MTSVQNPFGEVTYYEYRLDGQVSRKTLGNGCVTYHEFDAIGRTTKVDNRKGDMTAISSFAYERDEVGNPLSIEREDGYTVYYDYDAKHQLTGERHLDGGEVYAWEWDYDAAGNREHQVFNGEATYYEYDAANELLTETAGEETTYYDYDACGNTTVKQEPTGVTYYHWDHENLMIRLDLPDGGHSYFAYDADSKRVNKRDGDGFTEFIYQGPDMLRLQMERDESENTRVRYTMGSGLEAMRRADGGGIASGDSSFYHFDWLGSTFELTDESQAVTDEYLYNAWGEVLERTGTTDNPHQWVGRERYRAEAQLLLLGLRSLAGRVGRFWSRDSGREGNNWYTYCSNLPTSCSDPSGLWKMSKHHHDWTLILAEATAYRGYTFCHPGHIADGSRLTDEAYSSSFAKHWNKHFNFLASRDIRDWFNGLGSVGKRPDTRVQWASHALQTAENEYLPNDCELSAVAFGVGLHAVQDISAHMHLSAHEHMDVRNKEFVDNPKYDRPTGTPTVSDARFGWWPPFQGRYFRDVYEKAGLHGMPQSRTWSSWPTGSGRKREFQQNTCDWLEDYLSILVDKYSAACCKATMARSSCRTVSLP